MMRRKAKTKRPTPSTIPTKTTIMKRGWPSIVALNVKLRSSR